MIDLFLAKFYKAVIVALLSVILIFTVGTLIQRIQIQSLKNSLANAEQEKSKAVAKAIKPYVDAIEKAKANAEKVSAEYEATKNEERIKTEVITRTVQKIIERPIYSNVCFDDDGVRAVNSAGNTSQSETALP